MKLWPRFSIRTLAIFVAIVALILACDVWWVTWPKRTADRVVELLDDRQFKDVLPLLATENDREYLKFQESLERDIGQHLARMIPPELRTSASASPKPRGRSITPRDRSWSDVIRGRQQFILGFHFEILVERGTVSIAGSELAPAMLELLEKEKAFKRLEEELEEKLRKKSETPAMSNGKSDP